MTRNQFRKCLVMAAVIFLAVAFSRVAEANEVNNYKVGNLTFDYTIQGAVLKYRGVSVIRKSTLYLVSPGWTNLLFGHHLVTRNITSEDIPGGKLVKVSMANDTVSATYNVTLTESDTVTIDLAYRLLKDVPAEIEYCLGYISAPIIADFPFEAETVDGPKSSVVPHEATTADQHKAMLTAPFHKLRFDSRLANITMEVSGDEPDLVIFDARKDSQPWARQSPVFWCGLGVPARPVKFGKERHIITKITFDHANKATVGEPIQPESVAINPVKDAKLPAIEPINVIPQPKSIQLTDRDFTIGPETLIVLPDEPTDDDRFAAESLNEELREVHGIELRAISAKEVESGKNVILIGEPVRHSVLARMCKDTGIQPPPNAEGYAIKVSPQFVLVAGSDVRGTFYGVQTLIQLLKPALVGAVVQGAAVSDWPTMRIRGAHVFIGNEARPFLEKMIRRVFARHKLNYLCIQADYTKWDTSPGIWLPWSTSKDDLRGIIACAERHHMEVVPLVQLLGHAEWAFKNDQNLDISEDPKHPYAFCPSNPKTLKFLFSIIDETLDIFHPRTFHIGHDEVRMEGGFPKDEVCKKKTVSRLFLDHVRTLHDYLAKKGVGTMMWGDMLLHKTETPDAATADSLEAARERREGLPKDVAIADWHYCQADDFPSVRLFKDLGHEVIASTWYSPRNIEDFSRSAKKDGADGLMETLWAGYSIGEPSLGRSFEQFHAYILAAEYAWDTGDTKLEDLGYLPADVFRKLWARGKADHSAKDGFLVDLSPFANVSLSGSWLGYGPDHDLRAFPTGKTRLVGIEYDISSRGAVLLAGQINPAGEWPSGLTIPVGRKADSLQLLMTSGWHAEDGTRVGKIVVRYSNTESLVLDLVYGENTAAWNDYSSLATASTAWQGNTPSGEKAIIRAINWRNPFPDRVITSIEIESAGTEASPILFALTGLTSGG